MRTVQGNPITSAVVLPFQTVSRRENIFIDSSYITQDKVAPARCTLGVPFASLRGSCTSHTTSLSPFASAPRLRPEALNEQETTAVLSAFSDERYVLWFASAPGAAVHVLVALKDGQAAPDHLKAWAHAHELVRQVGGRTPTEFGTRLTAVRSALECVGRMMPGFVEGTRAVGWKIEEGVLVGGSPVTMEVEVFGGAGDDKKNV